MRGWWRRLLRRHRAAPLEERVLEELIARLEGALADARRVLELGSAGRAVATRLARRFPRAEVLVHGGGPGALPAAQASIDLVFSSLYLPWVEDLDALVEEFARVLATHGELRLASLGPDSFGVARAALGAGTIPPAAACRDLHELGDALARGGFTGVVLDIDRTQEHYASEAALTAGLARLRRASCPSLSAQQTAPVTLPFEVIYVRAWRTRRAPRGEHTVSLDALRGRRERA